MTSTFNSLREREIGSCFSLEISLQLCSQEIKDLFRRDALIKSAAKSMLNGSINIEDLLEFIEPLVPDVDDYIEGLEANLKETLLIYPWSA